MMNPHRRSFLLLLTSILVTQIQALTYTLGEIDACGNVQVTWSDSDGGDLHLIVLPTEHADSRIVQTFTIPGSSTSPHTVGPIKMPAGSGYIASMWDNGGYNATTTTARKTINAGSSSCLVAANDAQVDFMFDFSTFNPSSCSPLTITWGTSYTAPLSIVGLTPSGRIWEIYRTDKQGVGSFDWTVDVEQGEQVEVVMLDQGGYGNGGSSELLQVNQGTTTSCLTNIPPLPTARTSTQPSSVAQSTVRVTSTSVVTQSVPAQSGSTDTNEPNQRGKSSNLGAIVGGAVGGVAVCLLIGAFLFYRRRRQAKKSAHSRNTTQWNDRSETDLLGSDKPSRVDREEDIIGKTERAGSVPRLELPFLAQTESGSQTPEGESTPGSLSDGFSYDRREVVGQGVQLSPYPTPSIDSPLDYGEAQGRSMNNSPAEVGSTRGTQERTRLGIHEPDSNLGEGTGPSGRTLDEDNISPFTTPPLRLVDSEGNLSDRFSTRANTLGVKGRRSMNQLGQERPATIVRHLDAGFVQDTEGEVAGPEGVIHLPPAYEEVPTQQSRPNETGARR